MFFVLLISTIISFVSSSWTLLPLGSERLGVWLEAVAGIPSDRALTDLLISTAPTFSC